VRERAGDDARAQLVALFDVLDEWFNAPDYGGCIFLSAATEFPNPHDPIHRAAAVHGRQARDGFRDLALRAGTKPAAAEAFADCFAALIQGALVLRQTQGRNDAARAVRPAAEQLVRMYLPGALRVAG
jgi:hypothetical protein